MFAKKLKRLGRDVQLEILEGLPHGFLNFTMVLYQYFHTKIEKSNNNHFQLSNEAMEGSKHCIESLQKLLQVTPKVKTEDDEESSSPSASSAAS